MQDMPRRTRDFHESRDFFPATAMRASPGNLSHPGRSRDGLARQHTESRQRIFAVMLTFVVAAILVHAAW
jgi:hypothetical protein